MISGSVSQVVFWTQAKVGIKPDCHYWRADCQISRRSRVQRQRTGLPRSSQNTPGRSAKPSPPRTLRSPVPIAFAANCRSREGAARICQASQAANATPGRSGKIRVKLGQVGTADSRCTVAFVNAIANLTATLRQNGLPTNKQSQVNELGAPAVMVAVVPDKEHLALIAGVGGDDDGAIETTER